MVAVMAVENGLHTGGIVIGSFELLIEFVAFLVLLFDPRFQGAPFRSRGLLMVYFGAIFFADVNYIRHFFVNGQTSAGTTAALLTKIPYSVGFSAGIAAIALAANPRKLVTSWPFLAAFALVVPISFRFIFLPYLQQLSPNASTLVHIFEAADITSLSLLLLVSLTSFLSARTLFWTLFSTGAATLVLGDWALRSETLLSGKTAFGVYEFLWGLGVFCSAVPILAGRTIPSTIERFQGRSLLNSFRLTSLCLSLIPLVFLCLANESSIHSIKVFAVGIPIVLIFSALTSHYYLDRISFFSATLGDLLSEPSSAPAETRRGIPLELRETFDRVALETDNKRKAHLELQAASVREEIALKFAHDIRSPLSALQCVLSSCELPAAAQRVTKGAIGRIHEIAGQVLDLNRADAGTLSAEHLPLLCEQIAEEKRAQLDERSVTLSCDYPGEAFDSFVLVERLEFRRALSNILDNAIEAVSGSGDILLKVHTSHDTVCLETRDTGRGIPSSVQPFLTQKGFTYGKKKGNGLGLYSSRTAIESWVGSLRIQSVEGSGTTVQITLPRHASPKWATSKLAFDPKKRIVVIDDEPAFALAWSERLGTSSDRETPTLEYFDSPEGAGAWLSTRNPSDFFFLVDQHFGNSSLTGLDFIERNQLSASAILVTANTEDAAVRDRCTELNVGCIPKELIGRIPISH